MLIPVVMEVKMLLLLARSRAHTHCSVERYVSVVVLVTHVSASRYVVIEVK